MQSREVAMEDQKGFQEVSQKLAMGIGGSPGQAQAAMTVDRSQIRTGRGAMAMEGQAQPQ